MAVCLGGDPDLLRTNFHSEMPARSFAQPHGFVNEEFDALASEQLRIVDQTERHAVVDRMQEIIAEEVPIVSLYHPNRLWVYNTDVLDGWHYTVGGIASGIPITWNKHLFILGEMPLDG